MYNLNGITKQVGIAKSELEILITKKTSIVYKAMKLQLKKKPVAKATEEDRPEGPGPIPGAIGAPA